MGKVVRGSVDQSDVSCCWQTDTAVQKVSEHSACADRGLGLHSLRGGASRGDSTAGLQLGLAPALLTCLCWQGMALLCMSRPLGDCAIETQSDWGYSLGVAEWKGATGVHLT